MGTSIEGDAMTTATRVLATNFRGTWVRDAVLVAAATSFIAVSAQVAIPLPFSPVPLTGQTLAVLLTGAALGTSLGTASIALYVALALAGMPVLAPTADGLHNTGAAVLSSPTLGYLVGFFAASAIVGSLAQRGFTRTPGRTVVSMVLGNIAIYSLGLLWLHHALSASWANTIAWGLTPFLVGDAVKVALAAGLLPAAWKLIR